MLKKMRNILAVMMILSLIITCMPFFNGDYAQAKSNSKPSKITSIKVTPKDKSATISWSKAKGAKKYQIKIMLGKKKIKAVTTKKKTITVKKLKNGKTYTVYVRGMNGKKHGKWKKKKFKPGNIAMPTPTNVTPKPVVPDDQKDNDDDSNEPGVDNLQDDIIDKGDLHHLSEQGIIDVSYGENGTVDFIDGAFTNEKVKDADDAIWVLDDTTSFLKGFSAEDSSVDEIISEDKETFYRFSPSYKGLRVIGSQVILSTDSEGRVTGLTSSFNRAFESDEEENPINNINTEAQIFPESAIEVAVQDVMEEEGIRNILLETQMDTQTFRECFINSTDPELVIYAADGSKTPLLAYQISISTRHFGGEDVNPEDIIIDPENSEGSATGNNSNPKSIELPLISRTYYIAASGYDDVEEGSIILVNDDLGEFWTDTKVAAGTISNLNGSYGNYNVSVQKQNDDYRIVDSARNIKVYKTGYCIWDNTTIGGKTIDTGIIGAFQMYIPVLRGTIASTELKLTKKLENKAVYSKINIEKVYDFYKNVLGRESYDGKGKALNIYYDMHDKVLTNAAAWNNQYDAILIDESSGGEMGVDVLGHEYTHAVLDFINGGFGGNGEASALDEGYPDIMGNLIEGKTDDGKWKLGEDTNCYKYNMADKASYVSTYGGHYNARVFAHAAYLMMSDERTTGISRETWAKVFYKSMYYLTADATFVQARRAVLCAANRNGFNHNEQMAIRDAFAEVGIREPQALRIVLNWGSEPEDLDSHLVGPKLDKASDFHIYYSDKIYFDSEQKKYVADLDYDDTTSYGPEVTTIHGRYPGTYYFYVHDYTTGSSSTSEVMGKSGATIKIFKDGSNLPLNEMFSIRQGAKGTIWTVCKIQITANGEVDITPINRYGTVPLDENGNIISVS